MGQCTSEGNGSMCGKGPHSELRVRADSPNAELQAKASHVFFESEAVKSIDIDASGRVPVSLIAISDPGQDLDDEMAFILMRHLTHLGMVDIKGIICTLHPAFDRARLCRGTLDTLGLYDVPVGVGTDGGDAKAHHQASTFEGWARGYMPVPGSERCRHLEPSRLLFFRLLQDAEAKSMTILIIAALKDPALFLRDNEALFVEKVKEVVIMGGAQPWDDDGGSEGTMLVPDTAHNQEFDRTASEFLFTRCQQLGIPVIVVSRWAAYAAKVPRDCYDELATMGSSIGCRLRNAQRDSIESLWCRAARRADDAQRKGLPPRCDATWFANSFCAGNMEAIKRGPDDTIWDLIVGFMQYDSIALLCAIPELRSRFFQPILVMGPKLINHQVIGKHEKEHGVLEPEALVKFLDTGFREGLARNHKRKPQFILLAQPLWNNITDELLSMAMLRTLYSLGIIACVGIVVRKFKAHGQHSSHLEMEKIKKTLQMLGLGNILVYVDDYGSDQCVEDLNDLYSRVGPAGVALVVTGCLGDVVAFTKKHPKTFREKTQVVVHIGGANIRLDAGSAATKHWLEPDPVAQSNLNDMEAAQEFYKLMQESLLVPIMVISRHTVKACKVPMLMFDKLHDHGGTLGKELYRIQRASAEDLWNASCTPVGNRLRISVSGGGLPLPEECNRSWYVKTFCGGREPTSDSDVWSLQTHFYVYTSLAILSTLLPFRTRVLQPIMVPGRTVQNIVVGISETKDGIGNADEIRCLFYQCFFKGILQDSSEFNLGSPASIPLEGGKKPWNFDSSEMALQWLSNAM